ncbi:MAG: hypothetical protein IJB69_02915 [Clostridia bacterium]|nr:hypothetical protein [Clostridia bacterium]
MKRRTVFYYLAHIFVPLVVGILLYMLLRPDTFVTKAVWRITGISLVLPPEIRLASDGVAQFIRNHLADILWGYSLCFALGMVARWVGRHPARALWPALVTDVLMEMTQYWGLISGTFDGWDIVCQAAASLAAFLIMMIHEKNTKESECIPHDQPQQQPKKAQ